MLIFWDPSRITENPSYSLVYQVVSPKGRFTQQQFAQIKSIHPKGICDSLSLKKGNNHGKTVTAYVESKGN